MFKKLGWRSVFALIAVAVSSIVAGIIVILFVNLWILTSTQSAIYSSLDQVPEKQTVLILGAKVHADGKLSSMLHDRAQTGLELYQHKKVKKILISGDHGRDEYDEVNAIKDYLLEQGVPSQDIFLDHAGFDTYDSLYRARDIFQVESLIISTQEFHLARSVYLARSLGLDAVGIKADKQEYWGHQRAKFREVFARIKSLGDVILGSKPKFLGEIIPITGESAKSWDQDFEAFQQ